MFQQDENLLNTHYGAKEIEMLQTDIQRFLAILAFCLLPIFMLVQSIPVVGQEKDAVIERLDQRVENKNQELDPMKAFVQKDLKPNAVEQTVKEEKGLYVAFESDRVFMDLLEARKVQLFMHVTGVKQSFRVIRRAGMTHFEAGDRLDDLDLWEIKEIMVPGEILDAFRKWTTLASREMMFIVGLSLELSQQIREKGVQGGRILIGQEGKVHFHVQGE